MSIIVPEVTVTLRSRGEYAEMLRLLNELIQTSHLEQYALSQQDNVISQIYGLTHDRGARIYLTITRDNGALQQCLVFRDSVGRVMQFEPEFEKVESLDLLVAHSVILAGGSADVVCASTRDGNLELAATYAIMAGAGGVVQTLAGDNVGDQDFRTFGQEAHIPVVAAVNGG
jgi:hypothetical protein